LGVKFVNSTEDEMIIIGTPLLPVNQGYPPTQFRREKDILKKKKKKKKKKQCRGKTEDRWVIPSMGDTIRKARPPNRYRSAASIFLLFPLEELSVPYVEECRSDKGENEII
jgi:hypothetical protein